MKVDHPWKGVPTSIPGQYYRGVISEDCIFYQIAEGKIPTAIVYRDGKVMAFPDINTQAPVHILVMPIDDVLSLANLRPRGGACGSYDSGG